MDNPCYNNGNGCSKRVSGCHENCIDYILWNAIQIENKKGNRLMVNPRGCGYFKDKIRERVSKKQKGIYR